jgi:UDP-N-acetylmuramoyl-L-alanyl-D-glutamate--2,6-diaminopimelate ligase
MSRWFVDRVPQRGIPSVSLRRLLPEAQFVGCTDWEISGCCDDHRRLDPGQLFVAVREARAGYDGHRFVREALDRGAAGVVVEQACPEAGRLQVVVANARAAHARICQALSGDPSQHLVTLGVTGTYGQTITALMIRSILEAAGERFGLIGSSGFCDGTKTRGLGARFEPRPASFGAGALATPQANASQGHEPEGLTLRPAGLAALLAELVDCGCKGGIIEVSRSSPERVLLSQMTWFKTVGPSRSWFAR